MMNIQLTQYAWFKPRRVIGITLSVAILFAPLLAQGDELCTAQITYGKDPDTQKWEEFPNPCVIPKDWQTSPTLPVDADSVGGEGTGTTNPPPTTTNPPTDGPADCPAQITYAKPSETSQKWYLFSTPCDVPDGWIKADNDKICADVVVYAQNPTSKNWYSFVTPCDVPTDWTETSYTKPENTDLNSPSGCTTDAKYAQNLKTTHWYLFGLSCDVPSGADWQIDTAPPQNGVNIISPKIDGSNQCPPTLTYAQHPTSKHWYAFATPCEVPATWEKVGVVQQEEESKGESCEAFYATYSADGHLNIPRVMSFDNWLFKDIGLLQVGGIGRSYFLFSFDIHSIPAAPTAETK